MSDLKFDQLVSSGAANGSLIDYRQMREVSVGQYGIVVIGSVSDSEHCFGIICLPKGNYFLKLLEALNFVA
jgi:hypothetical protein